MSIIKYQDIENLIVEIRGEKVILDSEVAKIYGVQTKRINEAVKNNIDKFPQGYIIELNKKEWDQLKSKISTSTKGGKVKQPKAFTEKGLYMLATILKSKQATQATLSIIETFTKLRTLSRTMQKLAQTSEKSDQKSLMDQTSELMGELIYDDLETTESETTLELNFAVLKLKHTVKKKK
ncbi:MAG: ORF6N domain-containing protein [Fidelibacterota bacterium]